MTWKCPECGFDLNEDSLTTCRNCKKPRPAKLSYRLKGAFGKTKEKLKERFGKKDEDDDKKKEKDDGKKKEEHKGGALRKLVTISLVLAIVGSVLYYLFFFTVIGQQTLTQIGFKNIKQTVSHGWCYTTCVINPSRWTATVSQGLGDVGTYCSQILCGAPTAKKEGCDADNCVNFEVETLRPNPIVGSDETIKFTINMDKQAQPAKNTNVLLDLTGLANTAVSYEGNRCQKEYLTCSGAGGTCLSNCPGTQEDIGALDCSQSETCCAPTTTLISRSNSCKIYSLSQSETPYVVRAHFSIPCQDSIPYKGILTYDYETQGSGPIYIKQSDATQTPQDVVPTTSSGPLDFNIVPDQHDYVAGSDKIVGFAISLENKGNGDLSINEITLSQKFYPKEFGILQLSKCYGANAVSNGNDITIKGLSGGYVISSQDNYRIDCTFNIPSSINNLKDPWKQYTLSGDAKYTYTLPQTGSTIFVNTRECESSSTTSSSTSSTTTSASS
jgi:hypothetical protein